MEINYCYILAAGLGSRMGEIGKELPKPLWPLFEKNLLDLQIYLAKKLGFKKVYINTHHLHHKIEKHIEYNDYQVEVVLLEEEELLGSGGCIHNLASQPEINYSGNVLILNSDIFYFFDTSLYARACESLLTNRAVLIGLPLEKGALYNSVNISSEGQVLSITPPNTKDDYYTYSGQALIKLDGLKPQVGKSGFFESVVNFKEEEVRLLAPKQGDLEYWDFGTLDQYFDSAQKALGKSSNSQLGKFLQESGSFNEKNIAIELRAYHSREKFGLFKNSISLDGTLVQGTSEDKVISYKGIISKV